MLRPSVGGELLLSRVQPCGHLTVVLMSDTVLLTSSLPPHLPVAQPSLGHPCHAVIEVEEDVMQFKKKFEELVNYLELVHGCYRAISKAPLPAP